MTVATLSTSKNPQTKTSNFQQRMAERDLEQNPWKQYNSETEFHASDIQRCLEELAKQTFPTDEDNCSAYQEAIITSLTETLSPELGIKDFWAKMADEDCKTLRIENGHLNFYDRKNKKIDLTRFTRPITFVVHSSYEEQRKIDREQKITEAHRQLQDLIAEINRNRMR